ncbi:MAG: hypothetical protein IJV26_04860 [Lachnospiraceae bacterium]|nr:hypothetical protein [Lachnospiraceae bacterium]
MIVRDKIGVLERLLKQYERYYTINRENPVEPFAAEAEFSIHGEEYFLLKSAKYAEMDSREIAFYALVDKLDDEKLTELDERAWEEGLSRVDVKQNHRNTDISLFIVADEIDPLTAARIKKLRRYKSYRFGLWGWSGYRLVAYELNSGKKVSNYLGRSLEKLFANM